MRILLINKNPVISELLSFATLNTSHSYEETQNLDTACNDFDMAIVDDTLFCDDIYNVCKNRPCIILTNKNSQEHFKDIKEQTILLQKPFMPELLLDAIESFETGTEDFFKEKNRYLNESSNNTRESELEAAILDKDEIDKIQQLLNDENLIEESGINIENNEDGIARKDNVSYVFEKSSKTKEKELIEAILSMKPKKLKKFLKNANIKLNIEIKEH